MPFVSEAEIEVLEPFAAKLAETLKGSKLSLDRHKIKEFIFFRAKKEVLRNNPLFGEPSGKKTLENLISLQVDLYSAKDIKALVRAFQEVYGVDGSKTEPDKTESQARLESVQKNYASVFKETPETHVNREVDKVVAVGGLTLLHIAAQKGDFAEVKRLVEEEGAKVNVKDNSKMTARQRAEAFGHINVASYLANFS